MGAKRGKGIQGIGSIGCGAIVKHGNNIRGLVTAASIWNTGALGASVAYEREEIAIVLGATDFLTLLVLTPVVEKGGESGNGDRD